jgi:hypothetical protein
LRDPGYIRLISTGLVKPNGEMLAAIWPICRSRDQVVTVGIPLLELRTVLAELGAGFLPVAKALLELNGSRSMP